MKEKLLSVLSSFQEIEQQFLDPSIMSDPEKLKELGKKKSKIEDIAILGKEYLSLEESIEENKELLSDPEMKALAEEEITLAKKQMDTLEIRLKEELSPKNPHDPKNIILEVRSGAGGEEAGIFANDLVRMYFRFA